MLLRSLALVIPLVTAIPAISDAQWVYQSPSGQPGSFTNFYNWAARNEQNRTFETMNKINQDMRTKEMLEQMNRPPAGAPAVPAAPVDQSAVESDSSELDDDASEAVEDAEDVSDELAGEDEDAEESDDETGMNDASDDSSDEDQFAEADDEEGGADDAGFQDDSEDDDMGGDDSFDSDVEEE